MSRGLLLGSALSLALLALNNRGLLVALEEGPPWLAAVAAIGVAFCLVAVAFNVRAFRYERATRRLEREIDGLVRAAEADARRWLEATSGVPEGVTTMEWTYVLDDEGRAVHEPDPLAWGRWMEAADRRLALDRVGDLDVSTVFLGLDMRPLGPPPLLWETMLFRGDEALGPRWRYETAEEARRGHAAMVELLRAGALPEGFGQPVG